MKILILAGGSGKRLWPLVDPPKQFCRFNSQHSLLQKTLLRFLKRFDPSDLFVITQKDFQTITEEQMRQVNPSLTKQLIVEPEPKNTAPAIAFAIDKLSDSFLIAPSDHLIAPEDLFLDQLEFAKESIHLGNHILFGVAPTSPQTGFGYIQYEPEKRISSVTRFIEKPPLSEAKELLAEGNVLWHTGIVLFHTETLLEQMPPQIPAISIDHLLLEQVQNLKVISLPLFWSDLGSWEGIYHAHEKDANGNVVMGNVQTQNVSNCLIQTSKESLFLSDMEDLVFVDTPKGTLIRKNETLKNFSMPLQTPVPSEL